MTGKVTIGADVAASGTTPVSDRFIEEYMAAANDAQIKVYLFLLYAMKAGVETTIPGLADRLNYTEGDIRRAVKYWERLGLIRSVYDPAGQLTGLEVEDLIPSEPVVIRPAAKRSARSAAARPKQDTAVTPAVPSSQILDVIQHYLGRLLSPTDLETVLYIREELQFSDELLDYLVQYCVHSKKTSFAYIRSVALAWHEKGITTVEEARDDSRRYDNRYYRIMKLLGMENALTDVEAAYFARWLTDYGFSMELVSEACKRTVLARQSRRLEYCDKILSDWHDRAYTSLEDVRTGDAKHRKRAVVSHATPVLPAGGFKDFARDDYDMAAIEQHLVRN